MTDDHRSFGWRKTTFDGSRREQLRQVQHMTVRQRLKALDELNELSTHLQAMPKQLGGDTRSIHTVDDLCVQRNTYIEAL